MDDGFPPVTVPEGSVEGWGGSETEWFDGFCEHSGFRSVTA